jgi:cytochrome o ubiquinol oxidase operon protein cyoD
MPDQLTEYGTRQKTLKSYLMGLGLSLILTFIAFALVSKHLLAGPEIYIALTVLALLQLYAQVVFFLRLNTTSKGQWNTMPFLFSIVIVLVLVFGSLWIMYNLNYNMVH